MTLTTPTNNADIIQYTRDFAALSLLEALNLQGASECAICERWLDKMASHPQICPDGWYQPPPRGAVVLIGDDADKYARLNYESLRHPSSWPRDNIHLSDLSLIYAYASPIHRSTGLIGDIGVTLYRGSQSRIQEYLRACLDLTVRVACFADIGMEFRELYHFASQQLQNAHFKNEASSTATGIPNIGHTIPWSFEPYRDNAAETIRTYGACNLQMEISKQRISIGSDVTMRILPTMAFTIEPQLKADNLPLASYHVIVTFSDGQKKILGGFEPLFSDFSMMSYMESTLDKLYRPTS